MNRREIIAALVLPLGAGSALSQPGARTHRIAVLHPSLPSRDMAEEGRHPGFSLFFRELRRLGYVVGGNLAVTRHSGGESANGYDELARGVARLGPDVIFAVGLLVLRPLKEATSTIPIVGITSDPVALGFAKSLAQPGGNITGSSIDAGIELLSKRFELLKEVAPHGSRVAIVGPRGTDAARVYVDELRQAAEHVGVAVVEALVAGRLDAAEYKRLFASFIEGKVDAVFVVDAPENFTHRDTIIELVTASRLPAIYPAREFARSGGLFAYGPDPVDLYRQAAEQVDRILKGAKPADMPFYQPRKFELVVNLKAAKTLGITIPESLLVRADEVIE